MWNVLTVPRVWYFNCSRQYGMFLLFLQCGILTAPTVWCLNRPGSVVYFNCPRQCEVFLLFLQFGILTVRDIVQCSYCSYSVVI
jgi:hypothetical protein